METSQEKQITVGTLVVNYKVLGEGKTLLILHGWGSSSDSWVQAQGMLAEKGYKVVVPDLPGFGKTAAPSPKASASQRAPSPRRSPEGESGQEVWGVGEYAEFIKEFSEKIGLEKFVLAGHSFGGQTAIQFAVTHSENIEKLILIAAAGIRREPGLKVKVFALAARFMPRFAKDMLSSAMGKSDYGKAQGIMKDIMKKVIRQDLTGQLSKITMPTLIVWGDKDTATSVQDAYAMQKLIPNSKLEIIPGGKHALNFQTPDKVSELIALFTKQ